MPRAHEAVHSLIFLLGGPELVFFVPIAFYCTVTVMRNVGMDSE